MDDIKDIIQQVIGQIASKQPQQQEKVERMWKNILGKQELEHTTLVGIKEGCLSVLVDSPAWLYQMKIKKNKILERIKDEISDVKDIRFKIGKVK